jgi:hypothetical protein
MPLEIWRGWTKECAGFNENRLRHVSSSLNQRPQNLYTEAPQVGMVIGTFAALPYIHLQLEAHKRLYPNVPVLIHDDASPFQKQMHALADRYGCYFSTNKDRLPRRLGDLSAFVNGLIWANEIRMDILLKVSRRWVWRIEWSEDLIKLAKASQYATFSNVTKTFGFGFRTECMGMSVSHWSSMEILGEIERFIDNRENRGVESYMHMLARRLEKENCNVANVWRTAHPDKVVKKGYAAWDLMGDDRAQRFAARLWHDSDRPENYAELAKEWGLPYGRNDFKDPNMGLGKG